MYRVILEHICHILDIDEVVDCYYLEIITLQRSAED